MSNGYWQGLSQGRISRRRGLGILGGGAAAALLLSACGKSSSSSEKADVNSLVTPVTDETKSLKRGGTLKLSLNADVDTFDPHTTSRPNQEATVQAYSQLFHDIEGHQGPPSGDIEGDFVDTWEFSPDKLQLTLKINPNTHWAPIAPTNGRVADADDVVFSWNRFKETGSRRLEYSHDANPSSPILSMAKTDDRTVVVKLSEPNVAITSLLSRYIAGSFYIVPKEAADAKVLDLRRSQVGSGPWYLDNYSPSVSLKYKRNPGYKQDKRELPYIDEIEYPIVPEYAAGLAQFKAGAIYLYLVSAEDQLQIKKDVPTLEMLATSIGSAGTRNFFGQQAGSPFKDERVRQAWSLSRDRDLFIDVIYNVSKFEAEGVPMQTAWDAALGADAYAGWWLDPKSKDFGVNAKFYTHDIAEAKKLLAAAGFTNGVDVNAIYPATGYPATYYKHVEAVLGMSQDAGFRNKIQTVNFNTEWTPKYRNARGDFNGVAFVSSTSAAGVDDASNYLYTHYNSGGSEFQGGDAQMDDLTSKARKEFDKAKRVALVQEIQRQEGAKMFNPPVAGGANGFSLGWPAVRNRLVWQHPATGRFNASIFLDPTRAPIAKS